MIHEGIFVRKNWGPDIAVIKEYPVTYKRMIKEVKGHQVLDIGASIGIFAVRAYENGAIGGVCYEPETAAYKVLLKNLARIKSVYWSAQQLAIADRGGVKILYVPRSGNCVTATIMRYSRGRDCRPIKAVTLNEAIESSKATLLKTDCEGAELEFLNGHRLPKQIKIVCGELHREHGKEKQCQEIIASFKNWREIHPPSSYSYARCWTVAWERK